MKFISLFFLLLTCLLPSRTAKAMPYVFTRLQASDGLSDNQVQHILQLPDGRMVFTTRGNINLYDGMRFHYMHRNDSDVYTLDHYRGAYHVYVGDHDRLWVKDYRRMWCLDLRHERYLKHPEKVFRDMGLKETVTDFFVDSEKGLWLVTSTGLWDGQRKCYLSLTGHEGELQDVEVQDDHLYLFFSSGEMSCHSRHDGRFLYRTAAYPENERADYAHTSLVVKGPDGNLYQIRSGRRAGFFAFYPSSRTWRKLMDADGQLHTLIVPSSRIAYISSLNGIWAIDLQSGQATFQSTLQTTEGRNLQTNINTIYQDRQQGIWLGTDNQGILYAHPGRFKFMSAPTLESLPFSSPLHEADFRWDGHRHEIQGKHYNDVYTDSRGRTWAGMPDGLCLFLPDQQAPRTFYTEDGLPNNFVHALTEDAKGNIWASTSYGISRISVGKSTDSITFTNYRHEDGTLKGEYRDGQAYTLPDGHLLMGGVDGWTLFHPDSVEIPLRYFRPLLIGLSLHGTALSLSRTDSTMAFPQLSQAPPYTTHYEFRYDQNHIGFDFSALNYAWPTQTHYRYRLLHDGDSTWYATHLQSGGSLVDEKGNLHLSFPMLPPGEYRLQVIASTHDGCWNGPATEVSFVIHAPWWLTRWAYFGYACTALLLATIGIRLYVRQSKRRILRRHKEDILLLRIQHLIERCDSYERQRETTAGPNPETQEKAELPISAADSEFLNKAVALVEAHLETPGYSVEQLSKDLCMERSGLYKKLTNILDKSPSLFIRSIRLKRAADLILEGRMSMAEIAEQVGFSSASYMGKCFQEEFGCKPSEYAEKAKEST